MKQTPEQLKLSAAAMLEYAEGKPIQFQVETTGVWEDTTTLFDIHRVPHRPKPTARPWSSPDDAPAFCWLRPSGSLASGMVVSVGPIGLQVIADDGKIQGLEWDELDNCEWSTDRKQWFPCEVQE